VNILLVDDDISSITALANLLKDSNVLKIANNGMDALDMFMANTYDVVVTDFSMPKMNGFDLLDAIRTTSRDVPVIIVTGHADSVREQEAISRGADSFFPKPLDVSKFLAALMRIEKKILDLGDSVEGTA